MWKAGTLCITIAANIAKTAILKFDACFPDSVVAFNSFDCSNNIFVHYWFSFFQKILESSAPASAQKNINLKILNDLDVFLPPIELQNQFEDRIAIINKQKEIFQNSLIELETIFKATMQRAFNGELFI
jgi:type I restriction enzyme S subunit